MDDLDQMLMADDLPRRRSRRVKARKAMPQEDIDPSILGEIGSTALSGLSRLANILDVPGSMVRDVLVGENPLDQLLSPTTEDGRNSGRDVLEKWGVLDQNTEGFDAGDVAGFAADVLFDPTTYLTGGASAATKGGKLLKAAGLADNVKFLARKTGKGTRATQRTATVRDALNFGTVDEVADNFTRAKRAAEASGQSLDDLLDMKVGGTHRLSAGPLGWAAEKLTGIKAPEMILDAGEGYAKAADDLGQMVRYGKYSPVRPIAALFSAQNKGQTSEFGQQMAQLATAREGRNEDAVRGIMGQAIQELDKLGFGKDATRRIERQAAEGMPGADAALAALYDGKRQVLDKYKADLNNLGVDIGNLDDAYAEYFPRSMTSGAARHSDAMTQGAMELGAQTAANQSRKDPLQNIVGGTDAIESIVRDQDVMDAVKSLKIPDVRNVVKTKFGQQFGGLPQVRKALDEYEAAYLANDPAMDDLYKSFEATVNDAHPGLLESELTIDPAKLRAKIQEAHAEQFADVIARQSPDALATGLFGNHPITDMNRRLLGMGRAKAHADTAIDTIGNLLDQGKLSDTRAYGDRTTALGDLMGQFGLQAGDDKAGWVKELFARTGQQYDKKLAAQLASKRVPEDIAADMLKLADQIKGPEAVTGLLKAYDSVKNLSKAHWTGMFPAFHVRNLFSGQAQNLMRGMFSPRSLSDANSLVRGKELKGYADLPVVRDLMQSQGITETEAIQQLAYQYGLVPKYGDRVNAAVTGVNNQALGDPIEDMLAEVPGMNPFSVKETLKKGIGQGKKSSWKPWDVRGVGDRTETTFNLGQAAEDAGWWTEAMNRLSPFLDQLKKGVDPAQAKAMIDDAQVSYAAKNYTAAEGMAGRLAPFFKFSKGSGVSLAKELANNPGGPTGQALRAMNRTRDPEDIVPDHIAETAAIPFGTAENGDPRYLTGLGLMFEDPAQFVTSPSDALGELISRSSPLIKVPIEMASGESFFQRGGDGGRPLDEMDPVIGRLLANAKQLATGEEQRDPVPTPQWLEMLISNSPAARYGSTVRTLSDPRKGLGTKALNTLTGLRISDVPEAAVDAKSDEIARQLLKELGGREFVRSYMPDAKRANMTPEEQRKADALVAVMNSLATRAKERKAKREKAKKTNN